VMKLSACLYVRGPKVVEDNGVELAMALRTDHFDEVFVLFD
jgi:hypothetical protein